MGPRFAEDTARIAHEVNRAWCSFNGDDSQPSWDDAPGWQKESAVNGVHFIIENPEAGDHASHENWFAVKQNEGWEYGPIKCPETKTHPCMVGYDELPPQQQFKDRLFRTVVLAQIENWKKTEG